MKRSIALFLLFFFFAGLFSGIAISHLSVRTHLSALTEKELAEYYELKDLRAKYEKADELLGKMLLVLIADLSLPVPPDRLAQIQTSAAGRHPAPAASESPAPSPATTLVPHSSPVSQPAPPIPPTHRPSPAPLPPGVVLSPFNNGFARQGPTACDQNALGWFIAGSDPQDFSVGIDSTIAGGVGAAFISSLGENIKREVELNHCGDPGIAKHVRLSAWIRVEGVVGYANLHLRAENNSHARISDQHTPFSGTTEWRQVQVLMNVPPQAAHLIYGVTLEGLGKIWIRDVRIGPLN